MSILTIVDSLPEEAITFVKNEWKISDHEHFGRVITWQKEKKALIAKENEEILGVLEYTIQAGVMYIDELIVGSTQQGKGIGTKLMQQAEEIAKEQELHKIYLDTGENWHAVRFYEKLGYIRTGELPKHYEGITYIIFSKFL